MQQNEIVFAYVDAQEEVRSTAPLNRDENNELSVESFPSYPRMNFTDIPKYEGTKIFVIGAKICISYFYYGGRNDRFGRPVISAKIAMIPLNKFNGIYRDVIAIIDFLKNSIVERSSEQELKSYLMQNSVVSKSQVFSSFLNRYGLDFLSKSISCLIKSSNVDIYYTTLAERDSFLRAIYLLLPLSVLSCTSFASECESPESEQRETYVLVPERMSNTKFKLRSVELATKKIFGKKSSEQLEIHINEQTVCIGPNLKVIKPILSEILRNEEWYTIPWTEKYLILTKLLDNIISGEKTSLFKQYNKLHQMDETLKTIKKLESFL